MADEDHESDDEIVTGKSRAAASNGKHRARAIWENLNTKTHDLGDGDGNMEGVLGGIEEANKRRRYSI